MRKEGWGALAIAAGFAAVALVGANLAVSGISGFDPEVSGSASVVGMIIGMAVFFSLYSALDRAGDRFDVQKRFSKLNIEAFSKSQLLRREAPDATLRAELAESPGDVAERAARLARMLLRIGEADIPTIQQRLLSAGFYRDSAARWYVVTKAFAPFAAPALAMLLSAATHHSAAHALWMSAAVGLAAGLFGPELALKWLSSQRRGRVMLELPDLLDLLCIYTESGMSFDASLPRAIKAIGRRAPDASAEFSILEREIRVLPDRRRAFKNLAMRVNTPLMKNFVSIMAQSESIGTAISEALRMLSEEGRRYRMATAEQKAARIPVLINIPVVTFILPTLLAIVLGPTAIKIYQIFLAH